MKCLARYTAAGDSPGLYRRPPDHWYAWAKGATPLRGPLAREGERAQWGGLKRRSTRNAGAATRRRFDVLGAGHGNSQAASCVEPDYHARR